MALQIASSGLSFSNDYRLTRRPVDVRPSRKMSMFVGTINRGLIDDSAAALANDSSYSNTTVYYGIHEHSECFPVHCGVTNLIHYRRSCVDFTLEVRRMWLNVSTQA